MKKYKVISKKGSGTFSEVLKAKNLSNGQLVAIKRMKARYKSFEQVSKLREVQALRRLSNHSNIVQLLEVIFDRSSGRLSLVFELMDSNLYELVKARKKYLPAQVACSYMFQMLSALAYCHAKGVFHRDIKPENVLASGVTLKLADLGSCRGTHSRPPFTEYISTRWYRGPEVILSDGNYGPPMDIFATGCVMFELLSLFPLFPGRNETDQIAKIHAVLGTPDDVLLARLRRGVKNNPLKVDWAPQRGCGLRSLLPSADPLALDLLERMLAYDPRERATAAECLAHPYFDAIRREKPVTAPRALDPAPQRVSAGRDPPAPTAPPAEADSRSSQRNANGPTEEAPILPTPPPAPPPAPAKPAGGPANAHRAPHAGKAFTYNLHRQKLYHAATLYAPAGGAGAVPAKLPSIGRNPREVGRAAPAGYAGGKPNRYSSVPTKAAMKPFPSYQRRLLYVKRNAYG